MKLCCTNLLDLADRFRPMHDLIKLLRFGPGWLFVLAGLALCAAGILIPAQNDLQHLQNQRDQLLHEEAILSQRIEGRAQFLDQVERQDPALIKRLAASQLNLIPAQGTPVLVAPSVSAPMDEWVDATINAEPIPSRATIQSTLSQLAQGRYRLWLLASGVICAFAGLMLDPSFSSSRGKLALTKKGKWGLYKKQANTFDLVFDDLMARIELLRRGWPDKLSWDRSNPLISGMVRVDQNWSVMSEHAFKGTSERA